MNPIIVVVYWCFAATSMDAFNPHQLNAVKKFVAEHRSQCHTQQTDMLDEPGLTVEGCKARQMVYYMPSWVQKHPDKIFMGADCIPFYRAPPEPLDLQALKDKITP